jgi:hypothetical protein
MRLRQEDPEFEDSLGYIRPCLKRKKKEKKNLEYKQRQTNSSNFMPLFPPILFHPSVFTYYLTSPDECSVQCHQKVHPNSHDEK